MNWGSRLLALMIVVWLLTGVRRVGPDERAAVLRFGRLVATPGPGLFIGLPWGMDRVERVKTAQVRRLIVGYRPETLDGESAPAGQFLTADQNVVAAQLAIDYVVADGPEGLADFVRQRDQVGPILAAYAESLASNWFAGRPVDSALLEGSARLAGLMPEQLQAKCDREQLGVRVTQVSVPWLAPPEEVRIAFDEVTKAQTAMRTAEDRAKQEASTRKQAAATLENTLGQQALATADETLTLAQAEAGTFLNRLTAYRQAKATNNDILTLIWWEEMGRTLQAMRGRGRLEPLDAAIGPAGLDINQWVRPGK